MKIIGITGTLGAGKGTIVDYLVSNKNFRHYSVRELLTRMLEERGMELNRTNMVDLANDLRKEHGPSCIIEKLYEEAYSNQLPCIIESIRTPGEVHALQAKNDFVLFAVNADPELRYNRILERKSVTDHISYEEFLANEAREMKSDDPNKQNISACIEMADYRFLNNGTQKELYDQIENTLNEINRNADSIK
ncbi:MAG: AAA family ATPase [Chitinophagales bacterium]|nr:AAA family ATPase [Chitinophagales bacterium]